MLNRRGARGSPCFTPDASGNSFDRLLLGTNTLDVPWCQLMRKVVRGWEILVLSGISMEPVIAHSVVGLPLSHVIVPYPLLLCFQSHQFILYPDSIFTKEILSLNLALTKNYCFVPLEHLLLYELFPFRTLLLLFILGGVSCLWSHRTPSGN